MFTHNHLLHPASPYVFPRFLLLGHFDSFPTFGASLKQPIRHLTHSHSPLKRIPQWALHIPRMLFHHMPPSGKHPQRWGSSSICRHAGSPRASLWKGPRPRPRPGPRGRPQSSKSTGSSPARAASRWFGHRSAPSTVAPPPLWIQ